MRQSSADSRSYGGKLLGPCLGTQYDNLQEKEGDNKPRHEVDTESILQHFIVALVCADDAGARNEDGREGHPECAI